jgi:TetR/AcrR family transcriptional regulator, transcriptional repressor for nem operon
MIHSSESVAQEEKMGRSQADKREGHDRIVRIAAKRFREDGLDRLSIADLMNEAGLTHGGFYKHFDSRNDLVLQALRVALHESSTPDAGRSRKAKGTVPTLQSVVKGYLSKSHRDAPGAGCAVGALISDIGRAGSDAKDLYTERVQQNLDSVAALIGDPEDSAVRAKAIVVLSALAGAIGLARAVSDNRLSNDILCTVRDFLTASFGDKSVSRF